MTLYFHLSEFESELEAGESLDMKLFSRLNKTETQVEALKTVDAGTEEDTSHVTTQGYQSVSVRPSHDFA